MNASIEQKLSAPFLADEIEWRAQTVGVSAKGKPYAMVLAYVTNRAIQQRLDDVFGCLGWKNEYKPSPNGGVMCGISVYNEQIKDWVTKWDGSENTEIEAVKGGLSGAMKRAAVQYGIGRYLYNLPSTFAVCQLERPSSRDGWHEATTRDKKTKIYWQTPLLPEWALPKGA